MIRALLIAIAAVSAMGVHADGVAVLVPETVRSCGKWLEVRKQSNQKSWQAESWLTGFASGLAVGSDRDFLRRTDEASILYWIDKYCRESPLSSPTAGVKILSNELQRKQ